MTDPSARSATQSHQAVDLASLRDLVADALSAVAGTLLLASGVLAVLILFAWGRSAQELSEPDFPGRYLLAFLPMLVASGWLSMYASGMRSDRR
jgi:hypothetical protein